MYAPDPKRWYYVFGIEWFYKFHTFHFVLEQSISALTHYMVIRLRCHWCLCGHKCWGKILTLMKTEELAWISCKMFSKSKNKSSCMSLGNVHNALSSPKRCHFCLDHKWSKSSELDLFLFLAEKRVLKNNRIFFYNKIPFSDFINGHSSSILDHRVYSAIYRSRKRALVYLQE